ncbi:hypothetical protein HY627_01670 [Candidatus Uhrbacteria bacterium]|nr:hypothetical protein [Candidatus Uhrbacteria bacterium]
MVDSITFHTKNFITYSDEYFTKAEFQELKGKYGVFGRFAVRYTDHYKKCKKEGRYFPQVNLIARYKMTPQGAVPTERWLVVQVSLPKIIFGTNIFDMDERLLSVAAQKIAEALKEIQVAMTVEAILSSIVYRIDYSKMLQIAASFGTTDRVLRALAPYDLKQSSDFNRNHYYDGRKGFYLKYYNSSQGLVVYDKFDEIVANGKTNLEHAIAREYMAGKWKKGALRFELSIQKKQSVDAMLRKFYSEKKKDFTVKEVARVDIAKACLLKTFDDVYVSDFSRLVRLGGLKEVELVRLIESAAESLNDRAILYYLTHKVREHGLKATVELLKSEVSPATIGRYKRRIETILADVEAKKDNVSVVQYLRRKLVVFRPILPTNLQAILAVADHEDKV